MAVAGMSRGFQGGLAPDHIQPNAADHVSCDATVAQAADTRWEGLAQTHVC
jgi:hypothetical protein